MTKTTVKIPSWRVGAFTNKLDGFVRRARRLGFDVPAYEQVGEEHVEFRKADGRIVLVRVVAFEVSCPPLNVNGWVFCGYRDMEQGLSFGNIPVAINDWPNTCQHCNTTRHRKRLFILRNVAGDDYKQVGTNCLNDFTGMINAAKWADYFEAVMCYLGETGYSEDEVREDLLCGRGTPDYHMRDTLAELATLIRTLGYTSKSKVMREGGNQVSTVSQLFQRWDDRFHRKFVDPVLQEDRDVADAAIAWAKSLTDAEVADSNYLYNLRQIAGMKAVMANGLGYLASLIPAFKRATNQEVEAQSHKPSEWVGEVGKREEWEVEVAENTTISTPDSFVAAVQLVKFKTEDGNVLVWWSGTQTAIDLRVGDKGKIKATVKRQAVYKGRKETVVTRGKWTAQEEE